MALHLDPPQAHTINIEPMTATDWESELNRKFLGFLKLSNKTVQSSNSMHDS